MPADKRVDAGAGERRAEEDWVDACTLRLLRERVAQSPRRNARVVVEILAQQLVVVVGEHARQARPKSASSTACGVTAAARLPSLAGGASSPQSPASAVRISPSTRSQSAPRRSILFTNMSVGMRSRCSARIRIRVCGCTPSTAEMTSTAPSRTLKHALHLGDEVGVAGRVDQVDGDVVDRERDDRRLDRDAALLLERERIGLRRPLVDAADLVDDAGGVEQPLGESCLTGVYMRQDSQVQRSAKQASYPPDRSQKAFSMDMNAARISAPWSLGARRSIT